MTRRLLFILLLVCWLSAIAAGVTLLWSYESTPGVAAAPPSHWPSASVIQLASGHDTLVMLAHPQCPCTRASIEELARLMTHSQGRLSTYVLFMKPKGSSEDWYKTDLWKNAVSIPGVTALVDEDGIEAARFGAATSSQVVLYDASGGLLFSGGITESRGHSGDNVGRSAIESFVNTGTADRDTSHVFGCPLFDPNSECRKSSNAKVRN